MPGDMKIADVRKFDEGKLKDELVRLRKEQFNLRFQQATGQLEKPSRIKDVRRDIARVETVLREQANRADARA